MRAVVQDRYGGGDALHIEEVDVPTPDATSVLVKVRSASINALDWRTMQGRPVLARFLGFGFRRPKRRIRGIDVSGEVVSVSKPDSRFHAGEAVYGLGSGSFAEYVAADESELVAKPENVTFPQASTLGIAAFTALIAVRDVGRVAPGQSVLILGAGSGVGVFAVQLARELGARVTATTRARNREMVRSIGAETVLDYAHEDVRTGSGRYDAILDVSGLYSLRSLRKLLRPSGTLVVVGARGGLGRLIAARVTERISDRRVRLLVAKCRVEDLRYLGELVGQGKLRPVIEREFSLDQAPRAMAEAAGHDVGGKLVVNVA